MSADSPNHDSTLDATGAGAAPPAPRADRIGRFAVLRLVGEGAMGSVFAAYDEVLDRRVAVKVLRRRVDETSRARMVREAQALAKLNHPGVVQVFEAGEHDGQPWIAMEFVQGQDLCAWANEPRAITDVLDVYQQAGRALAVAHAAGLVHRDFKPHNAMIDAETGRVVVLDFGLAGRRDAGDQPEAPPTHRDVASGSALDTPLTWTGAVLGTPAYMAPEQIAGEIATPLSDQFSFCVSLWEAAFGERPFRADNVHELMRRVTQSEREPLPPRSRGHAWLVRVLERGLARQPHDRWPDMAALLVALARDPRRARRRRWQALGVVTLASGIVSITWQVAQRDAGCEGLTHELDAQWTDERRAALHAGLAGVQAGFAEPTADRVDALLDAYAQQLGAARRETCEATLVRREQSEASMSEQLRCLDARARAFEATVELLEQPDLSRLAQATHAASALPRIEPCADPAYLSAEIPPPGDPELAAQVDAVRRELAASRAAGDLEDHARAIEIATRALASVESLDYPPVQIEARATLADALIATGEIRGATEHLDAAYVGAGRASVQVQSHTHLLLGKVFKHRGAYDDAQREIRRACELLTDAFGPSHLEVGLCGAELGTVLQEAGSYDAALAQLERAHEVYQLSLGSEHPRVATLRNNLGSVLRSLGSYELAIAEQRAALAIWGRTLGPEHPRNATALGNIAGSLLDLGRYDEAEELERRGLALVIAAYGNDHLAVARARNNLGYLLHERGDYSGALAETREAQRIFERELGADHPSVAKIRNNIGTMLRSQGDYQGALREHRAALASRERTLGADHDEVATSHNNIAANLQQLGELEASLAEYREALATWQRALPAGHPKLGMGHHNLGTLLTELGRYDESLAELREALAIRERHFGTEHPDVSSTRNSIARVLGAQGSYDEALELASAVLAAQERELGLEHPHVATVLSNVGELQARLGAYSDAIASHRRALAIRERALGRDHELTSASHTKLADALRQQGALADAAIEYRLAADVHDRVQTPDPFELCAVAAGLALSLRAPDSSTVGRCTALAARAEHDPVLAAAIELVEVIATAQRSPAARRRLTAARATLNARGKHTLTMLADAWLR